MHHNLHGLHQQCWKDRECTFDQGIDSVAYTGEMDVKSRAESYGKWRQGDVKVTVATSAFGMGVNKKDIQHIVRYGVPDNLCNLAQELGRAGRDGQRATATIFYSMSDIDHAGAWIREHFHNRDHVRHVLDEFSTSWRYTMSHLAAECRRKMLLQLFGEDTTCVSTDLENCCDVCSHIEQRKCAECIDELTVVVETIDTIGDKGEVKVAQWIRGTSLGWMAEYDRNATSYGKSMGHTEMWWRIFMRQCHVSGLLQKQLRSIIKKSGHYCVQGIICVLPKARAIIAGKKTLILPVVENGDGNSHKAQKGQATTGTTSINSKTSRQGKGCHALGVVRKLLLDRENWKIIETKRDYQFPGVFESDQLQSNYYTPDVSKLDQADPSNPHFMWDGIQLTKGKLNKDRLITVEVNDENLNLMCRSAPCNGVKNCPVESCNFVSPMSRQRPCNLHTDQPLKKTNCNGLLCPVEFGYLYPPNPLENKQRWLCMSTERFVSKPT